MKRAGVYSVFYPRGVYIGQTGDFAKRNRTLLAGGVSTAMVLDMPQASKQERCDMESDIADECERFGFIVISENTWAQRNGRGRRLTAEHRARIKAGSAHVPWTAERRRLPHPMLGKHHSPEAKVRIGMAHQGVSLSREHREAIAAALLGKPKSLGHRTAIRAAWVRRRARTTSAV